LMSSGISFDLSLFSNLIHFPDLLRGERWKIVRNLIIICQRSS
jgi:hypothetical protein